MFTDIFTKLLLSASVLKVTVHVVFTKFHVQSNARDMQCQYKSAKNTIVIRIAYCCRSTECLQGYFKHSGKVDIVH